MASLARDLVAAAPDLYADDPSVRRAAAAKLVADFQDACPAKA